MNTALCHGAGPQELVGYEVKTQPLSLILQKGMTRKCTSGSYNCPSCPLALSFAVFNQVIL
jgi:hypothetical protein